MMKHYNYDKINTIFKRDPETKSLIEDEYSTPEFEALSVYPIFRAEEKIDGTNIQVRFDGEKIEFGGRVEKSSIPEPLLDKLNELFTVEKMKEVFMRDGRNEPFQVTIFGEGYGNKIQKCGHSYISDGVNFIIFDILINNLWLRREDVEDIAKKLKVKVVPIVGYTTLDSAAKWVRRGFYSLISEDKNFIAEGLVLKTDLGLLDRRGKRIIAKIKYRDYN